MDQIVAMKVFRRVVELRGFAAAARDLGYSNAAVSKNISELEAHLGIRLLTRTTRRMSVTEAGQDYYLRAVTILDELDEADRAMSQLGSSPRGLLRVAAPMSLGLLQLSRLIPHFMQQYPEIRIELILNDRRADLVDEGIDVALRAGGPLPDSSLVARRIMPLNRVICAAPSYLEVHDTPRTPDDLRHHDCLIFTLSSSPREWHFEGPDGHQWVKVDGRFAANSSIAIRDALLAGMGLSLIPTFIVSDDLRGGLLTPILQDWMPEPQNVYALYAHRQYVPHKVRCFVDFLVDHFAETRRKLW